MIAAVCLIGWIAAVVLALGGLRARRRRAAIAAAAHELRGSATTLALAAATMRHEPGGLRRALAFESELERMRAGLADLDAARGVRPFGSTGTSLLPAERAVRTAAAGWRPLAGRQGRRISLRWEAGAVEVRADRGRLAQLLGNLLSNALEHGSGPVLLRGRRRGDAVVVEVRDSGPREPSPPAGRDHGHGLGIAARAAEEAGGRLTVRRTPEGTTAAVELPVVER